MRLREVKFSPRDELASVLGDKIAQMRYKSTVIALEKQKVFLGASAKQKWRPRGDYNGYFQ
jgi:hypothetical protein